MSLIGVVAGSALAVLEHPRWLLLSLAGFLVRGGLLLLLIPTIQAPTTAALANLLGPTLVGFVFGGVSPGFLVLVGTVAAGVAAWLILGGLGGAALDLELIRAAAGSEDLDALEPPSHAGPGSALVVRWLAHLPTLAVALVGAAPLVDATYQELIHPGDPSLSVPLRVILRVPAVVGGLAAAWVLGEVVGGLATRHLAWGADVPMAMLRALRSLVRPSGLLVAILTTGAVLGLTLIGWAILAIAFDELRIAVREGLEPWVVAIGFGVVSFAWLGALWLLAVGTAWRSAAWTYEIGRHAARRTGDFPASDRSGTLHPSPG